jgi:hypothetical protein
MGFESREFRQRFPVPQMWKASAPNRCRTRRGSKRQSRKRLAKQLGSVVEMSKEKARDEAKEFLATINKPTLQPETAVTLVQFVEKVYFPRIEQRERHFLILKSSRKRRSK